MTDTKRTLLAGFLIALLTLSIPFYLNLIGIETNDNQEGPSPAVDEKVDLTDPGGVVEPYTERSLFLNEADNNIFFTFAIKTNRFLASFSNLGGGSLNSFSIIDNGEKSYQYMGGYNRMGVYEDSAAVSLLGAFDAGLCSPCLKMQSEDNPFVLNSFSVIGVDLFKGLGSSSLLPLLPNQTIDLSLSDSLVITMGTNTAWGEIIKKTVFYSSSFVIKHYYSLNAPLDFSIAWNAGIKPTEKNLSEELTYSQAFIAQNKEIDDLTFSPSSLSDRSDSVEKRGATDWVAMRNKYFINALISNKSDGGYLSAETQELSPGVLVPLYEAGLNFDNRKTIAISQFFGPLDVDIIKESQTYLDRVMNFGWLPIQPFSRGVLWVLKTLHLSGLNYGIILILFAFLIRLITGPLTKKSFESSQKMQAVQPKMKKIQTKYKNDSQRLNQEMVKLYKTEGVNPMGGCLPMLIQMPLLFSLFIVFRSTIEFRGASFFWWIKDLSQPDILFYLPFHIPIYGAHVGLLPIVLGVSMFFSQRLSMATMDKSQRPIMYFMTAFFFLLFNQFPSGLNLYYTVYNVLNYFQQKGLKKV